MGSIAVVSPLAGVCTGSAGIAGVNVRLAIRYRDQLHTVESVRDKLLKPSAWSSVPCCISAPSAHLKLNVFSRLGVIPCTHQPGAKSAVDGSIRCADMARLEGSATRADRSFE